MAAEGFVSSMAPPALVVRTKEAVRRLQPGGSYSVGRDPAADIPIVDQRVSWKHAVLRTDDNGWLLEDLGSTNGTFAGSRRIRRAGIEGEIVFRLGNAESGPQVACSVPPALDSRIGVDRQPTSVIHVPSRPLRIGRAPDNDVVLSDLIVSRYHAELRKRADGRHEIVDLGGHNGTFVNGKRITSAPLTESDIVGIGRATFRLVGDELREFIDTGDVSLVAHDLTVRTAKGKVLLDHVNFPIPERCLVGVIGPSGAGKSTLLGAVTGTRPATEGGVRYDNRDLYRHYAELRHRIGLVPQEDILHTQLATRRALRYAAELRFPGDTVAAERNRRVDEVIEELGLTPHADTRIDSLSGGQRKRVSVALELLTKPSLLFLDEPTSGLDPGLDKSVMEMMRDLAHDGRTIVVVTHSVANLDTCDRLLVLVPGGRVAYYGPPAEGLSFFGKASWAEVFQAFDREPDRDWAAEFRMAPLYTRYVLSGLDGDAEVARPERVTAAPPPRRQGRFAQLGTLCRRYLAVIGSDRSYLAVLAVLPLVVGLLIQAMPAPHGLTKLGENDDAASVLLTLVIGACFVGAANSVRELVKERPIYRRERAAGLSAGIYLLSKILILGLITGVQAVLLVLIGLAFRPMPAHGAFTSPYPELMLAMAGLAIVSMAMGLLVSAAVSTSEKTMPLLVLLSLAQVILCGALMPLQGKAGLEQIAWITPSRWGLGAAASTVDLAHLPHKPIQDRLWRTDATTWATDMGVLAGLGFVFVIIAWQRLERLRPGRRTRV
jgi:ABC-type multidrug transport system ATPase subunit